MLKALDSGTSSESESDSAVHCVPTDSSDSLTSLAPSPPKCKEVLSTNVKSGKSPFSVEKFPIVSSSGAHGCSDDNSNSSDIPLAKFVVQHIVPKDQQQDSTSGENILGKQLHHSSSNESDSTNFSVNEKPTKGNIKRKRSKDSNQHGGKSKKQKRKTLKLVSDSDSDDTVELNESLTGREGSKTTQKDSDIAIVNLSPEFKKSSPVYKPGPASSKKRSGPSSSRKNDQPDLESRKKSPFTEAKSPKTELESKETKSPNGKKSLESQSSRKKKLDDSDILETLEDSLDSSSDHQDTDGSSTENESSKSEEESSEEESVSPANVGWKVKNKTPKKKSKLTATKSVSDSDSDDLLKENSSGGKTLKKAKNLKKPVKSKTSSDIQSSTLSDEKQETKKKQPKVSQKSTPQGKKKPEENSRIIRLQRYLKEAGIRVKSYKALWDGCKSDKARAAKLLELLQERGLKGKPTISECRRLKRKYEKEQEFMELNTSNIIATEGRPRRGARNLFASRQSSSPDKNTKLNPSPDFKKVFSKLRNIIDSEESD